MVSVGKSAVLSGVMGSNVKKHYWSASYIVVLTNAIYSTNQFLVAAINLLQLAAMKYSNVTTSNPAHACETPLFDNAKCMVHCTPLGNGQYLNNTGERRKSLFCRSLTRKAMRAISPTSWLLQMTLTKVRCDSPVTSERC